MRWDGYPHLWLLFQVFRLLGRATDWVSRKAHVELWGPLGMAAVGLLLVPAGLFIGSRNTTAGGIILLFGIVLVLLSTLGLLMSALDRE